MKMAKTSKTEQQALWKALVFLHDDKETNYYAQLCQMYDKITGVTYGLSKNTLEFMQKSTKENLWEQL